MSKSFIFPVNSSFGNFYRHLANFIWSHCFSMTLPYVSIILCLNPQLGTIAVWSDAVVKSCPIFPQTSPQKKPKQSLRKGYVFKKNYPKNTLVLPENLSPRALQIDQSGHTGTTPPPSPPRSWLTFWSRKFWAKKVLENFSNAPLISVTRCWNKNSPNGFKSYSQGGHCSN